MLLGPGAGIGFIYWYQNGTYPFIGSRGNNKNFFKDIRNRTLVKIKEKSTTSVKKAEGALLNRQSSIPNKYFKLGYFYTRIRS